MRSQSESQQLSISSQIWLNVTKSKMDNSDDNQIPKKKAKKGTLQYFFAKESNVSKESKFEIETNLTCCVSDVIFI